MKIIIRLINKNTFIFRMLRYISIFSLLILTISCNSEESSNFKTANVFGVEASDLDTGSFSLDWEIAEFTENYIVSVATDEDFTKLIPVYGYYKAIKPPIKVDGLIPATQYYCRVSSETFFGVSEPSRTIKIKTIERPPVPKLTFRDDVSVQLQWDPLDKAVSYVYDLSVFEDFGDLVVSDQKLPGTQTTVNISNLREFQLYYIRMKATFSDGSETNYNISSFTTLLPKPKPRIAKIGRTFFDMEWDQINNRYAYLIDVATSPDFRTTDYVDGYRQREIFSNNVSVTGLKDQETYYYRMLANSGPNSTDVESVYSEILTITTTRSIAEVVPVLTGVRDVTPVSYRVDWNEELVVDSYLVTVSTTEFFLPGTIIDRYEDFEVKENFVYITGLHAGVKYYTRIQAKNSSGVSSFSDPYEVTTLPGAPSIFINQTRLTSISISWDDVLGAEEYIVDVAIDRDFKNLVSGLSDVVTPRTSFTISPLNPGTRYYIRVRSANEFGRSGSSNILEETTN